MPDMKSVAFLFIHLLVLFAKSLKFSGARANIVEVLFNPVGARLKQDNGFGAESRGAIFVPIDRPIPSG
jgi:hypothetical protein